MTLEQLRELIRARQAQLQALAQTVAAMAASTDTPIEELRARQAELAEGRERLNALQQQEAALLAQSQADAQPPIATQPADIRQARGEFFRAALTGTMARLPQQVRAQLGAIPPEDGELGNGSRLLPTTMADYLLTEPVDMNPIREIARVTAIPGLIIPKVNFELESDDFITDKELAKELKMGAEEQIVFGRFKSAVIAKISNTVMGRSTYDIEGEVTGAIRSQLALRELRRLTATAPKAGEEHMSLYSAKNAIAEVSGANLYDAIRKAYAALHDMFRPRATVVMGFAAYTDMLDTIRKTNPAFFAATPEAVLGVPKVVFCDAFTQPVVGDYDYLQLNYDGPGEYDVDKDVTKGLHLFVETDWLDIHVRLKSAFRRAKVAE